MANVISDETIEYVGILAKLALSDEEKEQAKKDMADMLDYIDQLGELDTEGVEPMSHIFDTCNVFREDVVTFAIRLPPLLISYLDVYFSKLLFCDIIRCTTHQILCRSAHWECNNFTDIFFVAKQHDHTVYTRCHTCVRRCSELECVV